MPPEAGQSERPRVHAPPGFVVAVVVVSGLAAAAVVAVEVVAVLVVVVVIVVVVVVVVAVVAAAVAVERRLTAEGLIEKWPAEAHSGRGLAAQYIYSACAIYIYI